MKITMVLFIALMMNAAHGQNIERINPAGMTQPSVYSHLVKAGNLLFIAGQVALDADGEIVGRGDMTAQVTQVLENLQTILASEDADFSNVVKINIFTTNVDAFRNSGDVLTQYMGAHRPASTLVQIVSLARPAFLVEIEAIAYQPD